MFKAFIISSVNLKKALSKKAINYDPSAFINTHDFKKGSKQAYGGLYAYVLTNYLESFDKPPTIGAEFERGSV